MQSEAAPMKQQTKFIHIILGTLIVVALAVGAGYGGTATGSQTGTITAADAIEITVPGTASITAHAGVAGGCGDARTNNTGERKKKGGKAVPGKIAYTSR